MTDNKLKPCPFCAGIAAEAEEDTFSSDRLFYFIRCKNCLVRTDGDRIRSDAAIVWNRRTGGWISVDERLPETTTESVLVTSRGVVTSAYFDDEGYFFYVDSSGQRVRVDTTHWQPLPPPPTK